MTTILSFFPTVGTFVITPFFSARFYDCKLMVFFYLFLLRACTFCDLICFLSLFYSFFIATAMVCLPFCHKIYGCIIHKCALLILFRLSSFSFIFFFFLWFNHTMFFSSYFKLNFWKFLVNFSFEFKIGSYLGALRFLLFFRSCFFLSFSLFLCCFFNSHCHDRLLLFRCTLNTRK